jgi:hypothetical protein
LFVCDLNDRKVERADSQQASVFSNKWDVDHFWTGIDVALKSLPKGIL